MSDVWNLSVARVDWAGNLFLDGGISYSIDGVISVPPASTDTDRFSNLTDTYILAKSSTPNGAALSATNRVCVLLPPGGYDSGLSTLTLDADFVDIVAQVPEIGGYPVFAENSASINYKPPRTLIYTTDGVDLNAPTPVIQSADDVRLTGFGIVQLSGASANIDNQFSAFRVSSLSNGASTYSKMYFWTTKNGVGAPYQTPTFHDGDVNGTWVDCVSNDYGFRVFNTDGSSNNFRAKMYRCWGGASSFIGEYDGAGAPSAIAAELYDCHAKGFTQGFFTGDGDASFSGCGGISLPADSDTIFYNCSAGANSFVVGRENAGSMYYCRGGAGCAGSTVATTIKGSFSGYAEGCTFGAGSLGGSKFNGVSAANSGNLSGTIFNCSVSGSEEVTRLDGATIRNCVFTMSEASTDCLELLDGTSVITGSTVLVEASGTGVPVNASSSQNVVAVSCTFNNGDNDSDGLGANVTNLALTASNGVY
jgi:hypothetical protein